MSRLTPFIFCVNMNDNFNAFTDFGVQPHVTSDAKRGTAEQDSSF